MRRKLTIVALAVMMLAGGEPAFAQSPNLQIQVKPPQLRIQPKVNKAPIIRPTVPPSIITRNIMAVMPTAKVLKLVTLPSGDFVATIRVEDRVRKIRVDGETGAVQN
ncbi:hypothetical protein [Taklimakanibacter lacteus]|uniref:hypothetical protein n=1 Tax=Taklimakanibacter lacteus TaxID=2268456 RepID=UPI0013C4CDDE